MYALNGNKKITYAAGQVIKANVDIPYIATKDSEGVVVPPTDLMPCKEHECLCVFENGYLAVDVAKITFTSEVCELNTLHKAGMAMILALCEKHNLTLNKSEMEIHHHAIN